MRQLGSVIEFIEDFEFVASLVPRQPELQYVGYFLSGLKEEIRERVEMHHPVTRLAAMKLARTAEAAIVREKGGGHGEGSRVGSWLSRVRKVNA